MAFFFFNLPMIIQQQISGIHQVMVRQVTRIAWITAGVQA
jgi:hypothetical protein